MDQNLEKEMKLKQLDIQVSFYQQAIFQKTKIALVLASLSAAILIVATFGGNLLPFETIHFKIAITILLSLIPISLFIFLLENSYAISTCNNNIGNIVGMDMKAEMKKIEKDYGCWKKLGNKLCSYFPYFGIFFIFVVVVYIIVEIWK
jgi:hypothetical protein